MSLYEKYGGEGTIKTLVEAFYDRVLKDPALGPVFKNSDMGALKRHQALFISQALGGPKKYDGREMGEAHQGLAITDDQFDRVAAHLSDSMAELGVSEEDIGTIAAIVNSLRGQIVSADEADSGGAGPEKLIIETPAVLSVVGADAAESLYEKLGGEHTIKTLVEKFYERVLGDAALAPAFQGVEMGALKRHQALFFSQALGGPKQYDGKSMYEAHKHLAVSGEQFDAVAGHLVATLRELGVGQADIDTVVGVVAPLKDDIVLNHFRRWLRAG